MIKKRIINFNNSIKLLVLLFLLLLINKSFSISKLIIVKNPSPSDWSNFTIFYKLENPEKVDIIEVDKKIHMNFCYISNVSLECSKKVTGILAIKIPYLKAHSKIKLLIVSTNKDYSSTPDKVFTRYVDYINYFPDKDNPRYRTKGESCYYYGNDYYLEFNDVFDFSDNPTYRMLFLIKTHYGLDSDLDVIFIDKHNKKFYFIKDWNTGYNVYSIGLLTINKNYIRMDYSGTRILEVTNSSLSTFKSLRLQDTDADNIGFCMKRIIIYREFPYKIEEKYPIIVNYTFNPVCYIKEDYEYKRISCDNLPINKDILIINKDEDLFMEIKNFRYDPLKLNKVKIVLNKLDEGPGYVKFVSAIENASFDYALVKVPIISEVNKELIEVTKNNEPYHIEKYYLTFKFNETDPLFEAYFFKKENKNLINRFIEIIKSIIGE